MRIFVDAMGSDDHPGPDVAGAVMAARESGDAIILVGDRSRVEAALAAQDTSGLNIEVRHATEAIGMKDSPSAAARDKRQSSMHVGLGLVRAGEAEAFVSAGNTGGILAVATLRQTGVGRIPGVLRPAMGVIFPIDSKPLLIDNGANAEAKPEYLLQFGLMGSVYVERMLGIVRPRVALISNGEEEGKGNLLIKETIPLMEASGLNYVGNIEPKEFVRAAATVNCDARDMRRASLKSMWSRAENPLTSPAMRVVRSVASNCVMGPTPETPASRLAQLSSTEWPSGLSMPMPVMTTRGRPRASRSVSFM